MRVAIVDIRAAAVRSAVAETGRRGPRRVMDRTVAVGLSPSGTHGEAGLVARGTGDVLLETARRFHDAHVRLDVGRVVAVVDPAVRPVLETDGLLDEVVTCLGAEVAPTDGADHDGRGEGAALLRAARHHGVVGDGPVLLVELASSSARVVLAGDGRLHRHRVVPLRDLTQLADLAVARPDGSWLDAVVAMVAPLLDGLPGEAAAQAPDVVLAGEPARALAAAAASRTWRRPLRACDRVRLTASTVLAMTGEDPREATGAAVVAAGLLATTGRDAVTCTDADPVDGHLLRLLGTEQPTPLPVRVVEAAGDPTLAARQVAALAVALFDQLAEVTGLDAADRDVLEAAALVHDIARGEGAGHHRRAGDRVLDLPVRGVEPGRLVEVACVVRAQRGRAPGGHVPVFLRLPAERREAVARMAALLRLAMGLDLGGDGAVASLRASVEAHPGGIGLPGVESRLVCVEAHGDRLDLALYGARGTARYVEHVLGVRLVVRAAGSLAATT